jgi:hypothetical protein
MGIVNHQSWELTKLWFKPQHWNHPSWCQIKNSQTLLQSPPSKSKIHDQNEWWCHIIKPVSLVVICYVVVDNWNKASSILFSSYPQGNWGNNNLQAELLSTMSYFHLIIIERDISPYWIFHSTSYLATLINMLYIFLHNFI